MATICSWCGKQIGFTDMTYTHETIDNNEYFICGECSRKISSAQNGNITFEEIKTAKTELTLLDHFTGRNIRQFQQQVKEEARQNNPLYDDIHQIAGDLRFIKNYLIFCIFLGAIVGFLWITSML